MKTDTNETSDYCPLVKGDCLERACKFYTKIQGKNPQNGNSVDHWDCAISWLPILLIENSQATIGTSASINSFRNEMVKGNKETKKLLGLN